MRKIIFLIIFSTFAFTGKEAFNETSVLIKPESQLLIKGKTNVGNFECEYNISEIDKPILLFYEVIDNKMVFKKAKLVLDNYCFDCGSRGINKDFLELLKSDKHPEIELYLKEIQKSKINSSVINAILELHIVGKAKNYYIPITIDDTDDICVSGILKLDITDFGLEAPKKALGLIEVSKYIEINFQLNLKECEI